MELKHCPSCGGRPDLKKKGKKFYYECGGCWTQTGKHEAPEEAAEEWNRLSENEGGLTMDIWGDCEGCVYEGFDYDDEPCCRCRRNINLLDEYITGTERKKGE